MIDREFPGWEPEIRELVPRPHPKSLCAFSNGRHCTGRSAVHVSSPAARTAASPSRPAVEPLALNANLKYACLHKRDGVVTDRRTRRGKELDKMERLDRITVNPNVCLGQPTIRGMRITVSVVLKMLAGGKTIQDVLDAYPELEAGDIRQAMQFAAWVVSDQVQMVPA